MRQATVLLDGLYFGEGLRWRDGRLWVSDVLDHAVLAVDLDGRRETVVEVPNRPSGLGWLPDGRLLVVSMTDRKLLRLDPGGLVEHADLGGVATYHCNDMVVDAQGGAYVGNLGFDLDAYLAAHGLEAAFGEPGPPRAALARVDPDGAVRVAATGLQFPNGAVLTPDGRTLILAESLGRRLTAFDVAADGALSNRRVWAPTGAVLPDGLCLDAAGAVWVANPVAPECLRLAEGGAVLDRVATSQPCFACALGGPDRTTLCMTTAPFATFEILAAARHGKIELARVDVAGAGLP